MLQKNAYEPSCDNWRMRAPFALLAVCGTDLLPVAGAHLSVFDHTFTPDLLLQEQDAIDEHFRGRPTSRHIDAHGNDSSMAAAHHSLQASLEGIGRQWLCPSQRREDPWRSRRGT